MRTTKSRTTHTTRATRATPLSRYAAVPVMALVLLAAVACDSAGGTGKSDATAAPRTAVPDPTGAAPAPKGEPTARADAGAGGPAMPTGAKPTGPATGAQLAAALLAKGEVPDKDQQVVGTDRFMGAPGQGGRTADRVECAIFAQESVDNAGAAEAWVHREYAGKAAAGSGSRPTLGVTLSSHRGEAGAKLVADLDRAIAGCAAPFTVDSVQVSKPEKWSVAPVDNAPLLGDETLAYRVAVEGTDGPRAFTVVLIRIGPTVAHFSYPGDQGPDSAPYLAFLTAQIQKAKAHLGR